MSLLPAALAEQLPVLYSAMALPWPGCIAAEELLHFHHPPTWLLFVKASTGELLGEHAASLKHALCLGSELHSVAFE